MVKKWILIIFLSLCFLFSQEVTFWASQPNTWAPTVNCIGLPGCTDEEKENPKQYKVWTNIALVWLSKTIANLIQYVAVVAVITLMLSGIMYMLSWGDEEKIKKARNWIVWSLVWVLLSISAWWIINVLNTLQIW